jgi:endonuclease/exonuclease/phosphatase family metal-dependent hydrolase
MILIRSWNVFHGNSVPPTRFGHLREMVELVTVDKPGILLLQELPVWALARLEEWSGMRAHTCVARGPHSPPAIAAWLTRRHNGLFRSRLAGQAIATLVDPELGSWDLGGRQVSEPGRERRVAQAVRVEGLGIVANTHLTQMRTALDVRLAELERVRAFVDEVATPAEPRVIGGDLNIVRPVLAGYDGDGYEVNGDRIDHLLVGGLDATPLVVWPESRRVQNAVVLSDHAPVERMVG